MIWPQSVVDVYNPQGNNLPSGNPSSVFPVPGSSTPERRSLTMEWLTALFQIGSWFTQAFAIQMIWEWHVAPTLQVPHLTLTSIFAIFMIRRMVFGPIKRDEDIDKTDEAEFHGKLVARWSARLLLPFIYILIAYFLPTI